MSKVENQESGENWTAINGDCVQAMMGLPDESVDFSISSPPYLGLYVYGNDDRDLSNNATDEGFLEQFGFVVSELYRLIKPGRIVAIDCQNVPAMKERDGYIGLKDFRGDIIRKFTGAGFIFHSEHVMWKDPLVEAVRTKALGLMHKQLCKDSSMCRSGLPQYLLAFRKPGKNALPISHPDGLEEFYGTNPPTEGTLSHERWRRYASPVWDDVDFSRTLNGAREGKDENDTRHMCPMSLDAIARGMTLWSNPGDTVLSPFMGIGSEGYVALEMGRKFIGAELKESYWKQAVANLRAAHKQTSLFDLVKP